MTGKLSFLSKNYEFIRFLVISIYLSVVFPFKINGGVEHTLACFSSN